MKMLFKMKRQTFFFVNSTKKFELSHSRIALVNHGMVWNHTEIAIADESFQFKAKNILFKSIWSRNFHYSRASMYWSNDDNHFY